MDDSVPRFVHGGVERFGDLETIFYSGGGHRGRFWRLQSTDVRDLHALHLAHRRTGYRRFEDGGRSAAPQAGRERENGSIGQSPAGLSQGVPSTDHQIFGWIGPEPCAFGALFSLRTYHKQHRDRTLPDPV